MYFGFNSLSKEFFKEKNGGSDLKLYQMFLGGAAAGFGFWGFLYPLDVIKSRMQVQSVRDFLSLVMPHFKIVVNPSLIVSRE